MNMEVYEVFNIVGISDETPPDRYSSWINFRETNTRSRAKICANIECETRNNNKKSLRLEGAHVELAELREISSYIVPFCSSCQKIDSDLKIKIDLRLVEIPPALLERAGKPNKN